MAGGPSRTLKLRYVGDASGLNKANEEAESGLSRLGEGAKKFGKVAAAGAAAAVAALAVFAKKGIDAAIESEAANARLANILTNTGLATQEQIKGLNAQAAALEKVGVASAGNITVLQAQLATFDLTAETIATLTPAITDYVIAEKGAAAGADDFQSAANGLAQALQGNFASLTRTGFVLDETTKELITNGTEAERAAALVEVLGSTYAGFNKKARETSEGQLVALRNSFGALQEQIGGALLPVFNSLVAGTQRIIERLQELWEIHGPAVIAFVQRVRERFLEWIDALKERFLPVFRDLFERFREFLTTAREWWERVSPQVRTAFETLREPIITLFGALRDLWNSVKDLFAAFRSGEGDGNGFETFIRILTGSIRIAVEALTLIVGWVDKLIDALRRLVESRFFQAALEGFGRIAEGLGNLLNRKPDSLIPDVPDVPATASRSTVNINVTAGIGDPERIARDVRQVLVDSTRRTGVGVFALS